MMSFPVHTTATAPQAAQSLLQGVQQKFGFVPNLLGTMASEPALLEAYLTLNTIFEKSSLNPTERQLVLIAVSQANGCQYCLAAHSALAMMAKVDGPLIVAAREGRPTGDHKLDALLSFTREVTSSRGYPSANAKSQLLSAGYTNSSILAVVLAVGIKTLSNYTNHIAETPIDAAFQPKG